MKPPLRNAVATHIVAFFLQPQGRRKALTQTWRIAANLPSLGVHLDRPRWREAARRAARAGATLPDGKADRIEGFATEGDAGRWIKNESVVWISGKRS
jgi:hypothetical protein